MQGSLAGRQESRKAERKGGDENGDKDRYGEEEIERDTHTKRQRRLREGEKELHGRKGGKRETQRRDEK